MLRGIDDRQTVAIRSVSRGSFYGTPAAERRPHMPVLEGGHREKDAGACTGVDAIVRGCGVLERQR
jgi:hypothetical protein